MWYRTPDLLFNFRLQKEQILLPLVLCPKWTAKTWQRRPEYLLKSWKHFRHLNLAGTTTSLGPTSFGWLSWFPDVDSWFVWILSTSKVEEDGSMVFSNPDLFGGIKIFWALLPSSSSRLTKLSERLVSDLMVLCFDLLATNWCFLLWRSKASWIRNSCVAKKE